MKKPEVSANVRKFLAAIHRGDARNGWVHGGGIRLYVRRGFHLIGDKITCCVDLANLQADNPGNGAFTAVLDWLEEHLSTHGGGVVFVESILESRLHPFLESRGYLPHSPAMSITWAPTSRYKVIKNVQPHD